MKQLNKEQAIAFYEGEVWKEMNLEQRAKFQIQQDLLCMPFEAFHEAVEKTLARPVWTHEFGLNQDGIAKELMEGNKPPTFEEILAMIPSDKITVVAQ